MTTAADTVLASVPALWDDLAGQVAAGRRFADLFGTAGPDGLTPAVSEAIFDASVAPLVIRCILLGSFIFWGETSVLAHNCPITIWPVSISLSIGSY